MSIRSISLRALLPAVVLFLGIAAALPVGATSYVPVSDEALVDGSPVAAVVRVVSKDRAAGLRNGTGPATDYVVEVEQALKGEIPGGMAVVRVPGGVGRDGMALRIYGAPRLQPGARALLFLEPSGDGAWRIMHLLLGAFREVEDGGRRYAVRDLSDAREVRQTSAGVQAAPGKDLPRDFDAFSSWVADRAGNPDSRRAADYYVDEDGAPGRITAKFRLFEDFEDGFRLRWFEFDDGGQVTWVANKKGQAGIKNGGFAEFKSALLAWNNESITPVKYVYGGTTSVTRGLRGGDYDQINSIQFNDPNKELPTFQCGVGGVLAYGGPWYATSLETFDGAQFHPIANADIVINDGLSCFFNDSAKPSKAAEELFGHELGHTLGLNHACGDAPDPDNPDDDTDQNCLDPVHDDALMRAFIHDDGRGGRLNSDDQAGLRALYAAQGPAKPTNLVATVLSTTTVRLTWNDNATNETGYRVEVRTLTGDWAEVLQPVANSTSAEVTGLQPATGYVFRVRAVKSGEASAYSNEASAATNIAIAPCAPDGHTLCLNGGRFQVRVEWATAEDEGQGTVVPFGSDDSGLMWFFQSSNWEMLIKVLNGCGSNDHYWVFFAATTDVQFVVTVADTQTGKVKTYLNPQGVSADAVTDTNALDVCP